MRPSQPSDFDTDLLKDLTVSREYALAHPELIGRWTELAKSFARMFPHRTLVVTCTYRSKQAHNQLAKVRKGESKVVHHLSKMTRTPSRGLQAIITEYGSPIIESETEYYPLGVLAKQCGLEWGGFQDPAEWTLFQLPDE